MGMQYVEVIMRVEETFDLEIPDEDAERLTTVGEIYDYVLRSLDASRPNRRNEGWSDEEVWESLRALVAEESSYPVEGIVRETHLIDDLHLG